MSDSKTKSWQDLFAYEEGKGCGFENEEDGRMTKTGSRAISSPKGLLVTKIKVKNI